MSQTCCLQPLTSKMGNQQQWYFLVQNKPRMSRPSLSGIWGVREKLEPLNSKDSSQRKPYCPPSNAQKSWGINIGDFTPSQSEAIEFVISTAITNTFTFHFHALEEEMATHSSILAWRIPGMGEPGGLLSTGSHRVGHDWSDSAAA